VKLGICAIGCLDRDIVDAFDNSIEFAKHVIDCGIVELVVDSWNVYGNQVAGLFYATNGVVGKLGVDVVFGCCGGFRHCNKLVLVAVVFF
jgi:hypothetical protein